MIPEERAARAALFLTAVVAIRGLGSAGGDDFVLIGGAVEGLGLALDVISLRPDVVGRQDANHLVGTAGFQLRSDCPVEVHDLPDREFMQRHDIAPAELKT
jgi:hypothetical protein